MNENRLGEFEAELGELLRLYRLSAGKSETDVAKAAKLPKAKISGFELGSPGLSVSCFLRLASALDVAPSEVLAQVERRLGNKSAYAVKEAQATLDFMVSNRGRQLIRALSQCDDPKLLDAFTNLFLATSLRNKTDAAGAGPHARVGQ
ncbi:MAG: helix-turn-helix domain-containing protein [Pseudomonadota bacterium]